MSGWGSLSVLSPPEVLEPLGGELGVSRRVLNVAVPKPLLDRARVVSVMGELEAAGVAEHVRVDGEGELGRLADPGELLAEAGRGHRPVPLGGEEVRRGRGLLAVQATQGAQFTAAQDVRRRPTLLQPADMQQALAEVEHVPAQADELGDA